MTVLRVMVVIENNGSTIEIAATRHAKEGDFIKLTVDEVATKRKKQSIEELADELLE
ncbi:MAG: hypothetical protein ACOCRO_06475 [Halanaerobiales bacterium]